MEARKSAKKTGCAGNGLKCVFMLCAVSSHIPFKKEVGCESRENVEGEGIWRRGGLEERWPRGEVASRRGDLDCRGGTLDGS